MSWTTSLATSISFKSLNRLWKSIANSEATYSIVAKKKEFGRFCRLAALRPVSMGSKHSEGDHSSWSSDFDVKLLENSSKFEVQIVTHEQGAVSEKNNRKVWLLPISAHPKSASRFYPIAFTLSNAVDGVLADSVRSLSFRLSKQSPRRKRPRFSNWPNEFTETRRCFKLESGEDRSAAAKVLNNRHSNHGEVSNDQIPNQILPTKPLSHWSESKKNCIQ